MSRLRVGADVIYWLCAWSDALSSLVLLHLGFGEANPLYSLLGHYEFWGVYAAMSVLLWVSIKAYQHHYMHHKCSVVSYLFITIWAVCHLICTVNNVGQVI